MLEGVDTPQSPAWWIKQLTTELIDRRVGRAGTKMWRRDLVKPSRVPPGIDMLLDHLAGDPPLLGVADGWRDHFHEVARIGRLNVAALVVEAKADRMPLRGFRTAAAGDELGDSLAKELMRANQMKVRTREVHDFMLGTRVGYTMVTPPKDGERWPIITSEDPREVITAHDPATGVMLAGIKAYRDEWDSRDIIHLYVRQDDGKCRHYKAVLDGRSTAFTLTRFRMSAKWEWDEKVGGEQGQVMERMPLHRFLNRRGVGEFERHLDTLDRINDQILNKLVIAKVQAFRQQAIKGLPDSERKVVDGKLTEVEINYDDAFIAAPGSMWQLPAGVELWESTPTDLGPIRLAIKDDLEQLAAVTATPLHVITPDAASGSAEGASLMREQHVYAVEACRDHAEVGWIDTFATAFAFMGDDDRYVEGEDGKKVDRADASQLEAIWGPAERYSLQERSSAASQAGTTLPREAIQRDIWGYDPAEIPQLRALAGRDLLTRIPDTSSRPQQQGLEPTFQPPAQPGAPGDPAATS